MKSIIRILWSILSVTYSSNALALAFAGGDFSDQSGVEAVGQAPYGYVDSLDSGDWIEYDVNLFSSGTYSIVYFISSPTGEGTLSLENGLGDLHSPIEILQTNSWNEWKTLEVEVNLDSGLNKLRIKVEEGGWRLNKVYILYSLDRDNNGSNLDASIDTPVSGRFFDAYLFNPGRESIHCKSIRFETVINHVRRCGLSGSQKVTIEKKDVTLPPLHEKRWDKEGIGILSTINANSNSKHKICSATLVKDCRSACEDDHKYGSTWWQDITGGKIKWQCGLEGKKQIDISCLVEGPHGEKYEPNATKDGCRFRSCESSNHGTISYDPWNNGSRYKKICQYGTWKRLGLVCRNGLVLHNGSCGKKCSNNGFQGDIRDDGRLFHDGMHVGFRQIKCHESNWENITPRCNVRHGFVAKGGRCVPRNCDNGMKHNELKFRVGNHWLGEQKSSTKYLPHSRFYVWRKTKTQTVHCLYQRLHCAYGVVYPKHRVYSHPDVVLESKSKKRHSGKIIGYKRTIPLGKVCTEHEARGLDQYSDGYGWGWRRRR